MSLGLLVGRFGTFIRETHGAVATSEPAAPFPDELNHLREIVSHHLIPLTLLARSDGDFDPRERDVIVAHCVILARRQGTDVGQNDALIFAEYVSDFRPTLMQLDPALARLSRSSHEEMIELIDAAHAVIDADGVVRPEEKQFLVQLSEDLRNLSAGARPVPQ